MAIKIQQDTDSRPQQIVIIKRKYMNWIFFFKWNGSTENKINYDVGKALKAKKIG